MYLNSPSGSLSKLIKSTLARELIWSDMIGETTRCWCRCELERAESVAGAGLSLGNDIVRLLPVGLYFTLLKNDLLCHGCYIMNIYSPYRDLGNGQTHPPKIVLLIA